MNQEYREKVINSISGFGKIYLWAQNPYENINFEELKTYFHKLPAEFQKKTFRYLFKLLSEDCISFNLLQFFTEIVETQIVDNIEETEKDIFYWFLNSEGNIYSAIYVLIIILKAKLQAPKLPIKYSTIKPALSRFSGGKIAMFRALKSFFEECRGWSLLSYNRPNPEYFSRNGYVVSINDPKFEEYRYKVCFYEKPLDLDDQEVGYLDDSNIKIAEDVLIKNFDYLRHGDGFSVEEGYLIHEKDLIRLKEYITLYEIDDKCNMFNDTFGFGEGQGYGFPEHDNYPTRYKENEIYICNCGLYKDVDPTEGIL